MEKINIIMDKLAERLVELMEENNVDAKMIATQLNLANTSAVYKWRNDRKSILLDSAIKLADIFNCSLDFLLDEAMIMEMVNIKNVRPLANS